jgi:hypothetical protein
VVLEEEEEEGGTGLIGKNRKEDTSCCISQNASSK